MKANTALYPFWNPGNSGAAENFANPVGVATATLTGSLLDSLHLKVPQEVSYNKNYLPLQQYASSATRQPAPQMPMKLATIPTASPLLAQAQLSLTAAMNTGDKKK